MSYNPYREHTPLVPPVIMNLLIANGMIFFFQVFFSQGQIGILEKYFALWPFGTDEFVRRLGYPGGSPVDFYPWQILTYAFLHSTQTFTHILFNMLALWMFGREIEIRWGSKRFLIYYLTCVVGAGLIQLAVATISMYNGMRPYPTIGASGGTYGILLAFGMLFPYREVMLLFPPIPMQARWFVLIFGGLELFLGVSGMSTGVAHFAHLGGMLFGFFLIMYWRGKLPLKPKNRIYW